MIAMFEHGTYTFCTTAQEKLNTMIGVVSKCTFFWKVGVAFFQKKLAWGEGTCLF